MDLIVRTVAAAGLTLDGLTVEGVVVPYGEVAEVADDLGPTPVYRETFNPAAFATQLAVFQRRPDLTGGIYLNLDHRPEISRQIGWAVELTSDDTALRARFTLNPRHPDLDVIRGMLAGSSDGDVAGSHGGLSVEAGIGKSRVRDDGVVERVQAHLYGAAAVPAPAYAGAGITALRANSDYAAALADMGTPRLDAAAAAWGFHD